MLNLNKLVLSFFLLLFALTNFHLKFCKMQQALFLNSLGSWLYSKSNDSLNHWGIRNNKHFMTLPLSILTLNSCSASIVMMISRFFTENRILYFVLFFSVWSTLQPWRHVDYIHINVDWQTVRMNKKTLVDFIKNLKSLYRV